MIRYRHTITDADWSSAEQVLASRRCESKARDDATPQIATASRANFLWMCQGYYRHGQGYTPHWPGMAQFKGRIVHPQTWPDDLDLANSAWW